MPDSSSQPRYQQIYDDLYAEIAAGKYTLGQKLPSEAALVRRFQASRITVGRAVSDLRRAGLVERRAGSGTYVARLSAPPTKVRLSFGLIIPDLGRTEIFEPICQGISEALPAREHALVWSQASDPTAPPQEQAWQLCRQYIERKVSGVFFAPAEQTSGAESTDERIAQALHEAGIPMVLLDRDFLSYPQRSAHDLVGIDNRRTGFAATEHLLALGSRRIVFLALPRRPSTVEERIAGYREALFLRGLPVDPLLVCRQASDDHEGLSRMVKELQPDGFVCANDRTAGQLLQTLGRLHMRVPQDIRVIGIDDLPYASLLPVPLTTMHQPCREIGSAALSAMLERLDRPAMPARDILLSCPLVIRESCGARDSDYGDSGSS